MGAPTVNKESVKYIRHELRTYLNHVMGYSEILHEDLVSLEDEETREEIQKIFEESSNLQNIFSLSFYEEGQPRDLFNAVEFKKNLYGPLYIIIGLSQRIKKRWEKSENFSTLKDIQKVLEACRKILEMVEKEIQISESIEPPTVTAHSDHPGVPGGPALKPRDEQGGSLLVVDDNEMNRDILTRHLERQGHRVMAVENGYLALQTLKNYVFDLVLLDILMPGLNGYQILEKMKEDESLRHIPVIMISALDEMDSVAHCISLGAEDYLPKTFDPILLKARISACLTKKRFRDQEQSYLLALLESKITLEKELGEAAEYVKGLLPRPLLGEVNADWVFAPSAKLGGDCFDYHWVDDDHLMVYLLDVSGHGIGAALLSVSVMNVLRSQGLPQTDFMNPSAVLGALNHNFPMEKQNNMYFTIWYGIYHKPTRTMKYASAGAPPALLVHQDHNLPVISELTTTDLIIGVDMDYFYETKKEIIPLDSRLYLFSDGAYEVKKANGKMMVFKEFMNIINFQPHEGGGNTQSIYNQIQGLAEIEHFEDDFSLLELIIP